MLMKDYSRYPDGNRYYSGAERKKPILIKTCLGYFSGFMIMGVFSGKLWFFIVAIGQGYKITFSFQFTGNVECTDFFGCPIVGWV